MKTELTKGSAIGSVRNQPKLSAAGAEIVGALTEFYESLKDVNQVSTGPVNPAPVTPPVAPVVPAPKSSTLSTVLVAIVAFVAGALLVFAIHEVMGHVAWVPYPAPIPKPTPAPTPAPTPKPWPSAWFTMDVRGRNA